jgi:hypothetical protein
MLVIIVSFSTLEMEEISMKLRPYQHNSSSCHLSGMRVNCGKLGLDTATAYDGINRK